MAKKITKTLVAAVLLLILGYLGSTWYAGQQAEEEIDQRAKQINTLLKGKGLPVDVTIDKQNAGLFTSQYLLTMRVNGKTRQEAVSFQIDVEHGPLPLSRLQAGKLEPVRALSRVTLVQDQANRKLFELSKGQPPLDLVLVRHYDHSTSYSGSLASLSFSRDNEAQLHFDGAKFEGRIGPDGKAASLSAHLPLLQVSPPDTQGKSLENISLRDMTISTQYDTAKDIEQAYSRHVNVKSIVFTAKDANVQIADYLSETATHNDGTFVNLSQQDTIRELLINGVNMGQLQYGTRLDRLNPATLKHLGEQVMALLTRIVQAKKFEPDFTDILPLTASISALFTTHPEYTFGPIKWTLPEGATQLSVKLGLNDPLPLAIRYGKDPQALTLRTLRSVDVELEASEPMLRSVTQKISQLAGETTAADPTAELAMVIDTLVKHKLLAREQGHVRLSVHARGDNSLADTKTVDMNGESMPLDVFIDQVRQRAADAEADIKVQSGDSDEAATGAEPAAAGHTETPAAPN